jgi:hypothetical protein
MQHVHFEHGINRRRRYSNREAIPESFIAMSNDLTQEKVQRRRMDFVNREEVSPYCHTCCPSAFGLCKLSLICPPFRDVTGVTDWRFLAAVNAVTAL